jgi:DNA-directed RNA polymerase subunit B
MRELVDAFFRERSIVNHHIASYNDFLPTMENINNRMQMIVDNIRVSKDESLRGIIRLDDDRTDGNIVDVRIGRKRGKDGRVDPHEKPTIKIGAPVVREANGATNLLTPMEARLRNLTYMAPINLTFTIIENGVEREPESVHIGNLPLMIKSKKCCLDEENIDTMFKGLNEEALAKLSHKEKLAKLGEDPCDPGGYFIVSGTERVLISLEDLAPNRVLAEYNERYGTRTEIAKVFSQKEGYRSLTLLEKKRDSILTVSVAAATGQIPLYILMKALGMENDEDIYNSIVSNKKMDTVVYANMEECQDDKLYPPTGINTTEDAILWLEKKFATGIQGEEGRVHYRQGPAPAPWRLTRRPPEEGHIPRQDGPDSFGTIPGNARRGRQGPLCQ